MVKTFNYAIAVYLKNGEIFYQRLSYKTKRGCVNQALRLAEGQPCMIEIIDIRNVSFVSLYWANDISFRRVGAYYNGFDGQFD